MGPDPETSESSSNLLNVLRGGIEGLPEDCREAVVLSDVEGLCAADGAELAGIGVAAFKSRVHRGRMALSGRLDRYVEAAPDSHGRSTYGRPAVARPTRPSIIGRPSRSDPDG
jgi:RNA polymerase sigma-70 factor (ECF subfamily)